MATNPTNPPVEQASLGTLKGQLPLIGLTGGIGSGKTAVSNELATLGVGIVDTDLIAHQITAPNGSAILPIHKEFGAEYIEPRGALDRIKMRSLVFGDPKARKCLEQITHPLIRDETIRQAQQLLRANVPYIVFVVPLLIESGNWRPLLDYLVVVDCPEEIQIERVMHRSNLSREEVIRTLRAQTSRAKRLACADLVIENQGTLDQLKAEALNLHQKFLQIQMNTSSSS